MSGIAWKRGDLTAGVAAGVPWRLKGDVCVALPGESQTRQRRWRLKTWRRDSTGKK